MLSYLMKKIIIGATGAIGSSIAKKLVSNGSEVHLVARNQAEVERLAGELNATFSVVDVLDDNFAKKVQDDLGDTPINGLAHCVGSIDLKPLKLSKKEDFIKTFSLNLISATEIIRAMHENLKANNGSDRKSVV